MKSFQSKKIISLFLVFTFTTTQIPWAQEYQSSPHEINGPVRDVNEIYTVDTGVNSPERDFWNDNPLSLATLSEQEQIAEITISEATPSVSPDSTLTSSNLTSFSGSPWVVLDSTSSASTSVVQKSSSQFQMNYDVTTAGSKSKAFVSFDNPTTAGVEIRDLSSFTELIVGAGGPTGSSLHFEVEDSLGAKSEVTLINLVSSVKYYRISKSLFTGIDWTKVKRFSYSIDSTLTSTLQGTLTIQTKTLLNSNTALTNFSNSPFLKLFTGVNASTSLMQTSNSQFSLNYDISGAATAGVSVVLDNPDTGTVETGNLSSVSTFTFGLSGPSGGKIKLEFEDVLGAKSSAILSALTSSNQYFTVSKNIFTGLDWTKIKQINFSVDATLVGPLTGAITIRAKTLYYKTQSATTFPGSPVPLIIEGSSSPTYLTATSTSQMRMNFDVTQAGSFAGTQFSFDNLTTSAIETQDLSQGSTFTVGIQAGNSNIKKVRLEVEDITGAKTFYLIQGLTTGNQYYTFQKSLFPGIDWTKVKSLNFVLDQSMISASSAYVKWIQFTLNGFLYSRTVTPCSSCTSASVTTLPGGPTLSLLPGSSNGTALSSAQDTINLSFDLSQSQSFSGARLSYDNPSTSSIETGSLPSTLVFGLKGAANTVRVELTDVTGKKASVILTGITTTEKFFSLTTSWFTGVDKTKVKWIQFIIDPVTGNNAPNTGYLVVTVKGFVAPVTPPTIQSLSIDEGVTVNIPYLAISYEVEEGGNVTTQYQEINLIPGLNTVEIIASNSVGEDRVIRNIYYVPNEVLDSEQQALRNRYIDENSAFFQEGQGIDAITGFPVDVIGPNAPQGVTWTQPTSIGFYLEFLADIITKRTQVDFLTQPQAISQARKVLTNLLQSQTQWGWKGLIPWMELQPTWQPSNNLIGLIDNANLSHSLAIFEGALERANLDDTVASDLYNMANTFLLNQHQGYQSFVDSASGVFRGTYDKQTQQFDGYADRFGSEVRATIPFLIAYFNLPNSVWDNLIQSTSRYLTQKGRVVETFSAYDGGGFQYFWPLLKSPEDSLANISELLQNALLIHDDFMNANGLPGFVSAASLPEGGYDGKIGIEALKETPLDLDETLASVYSLASAYRLNPEFVLNEIQKIETSFPFLKGSLGFYDSARASGAVSQNYYAIDQGSFVLGLIGHGADDFKLWMQNRGLWTSYENLYSSLNFGIDQAVETLPESDMTYDEIHNGHINTGNLYDGRYNYNQFSGNNMTVTEQADGSFRYVPLAANGWNGGFITPSIDLSQYSFVNLQIRNAVSGNNQLTFEVKNANTFLLEEVFTLQDNEWHTFQFIFPKTVPDANFVSFTHASGAFEVKNLSFTDLPIFPGAFPPTITMASNLLTNDASYLLQYEINGVALEETVAIINGENTIRRVFEDSYGRSVTYDFNVTLDTAGPVLSLISSTTTSNANYTLAYAVDGITTNEILTLTEGKNFIVRSATDAAGNRTTATFQITLDSAPPVVELFQINQGNTVAKSADVTLNIVGYDLGSQVTEMSFSNDGVNFTEAEPFSSTKAWTLEDGKGDKTVWIKLKDARGFWSNPVTDTIFYEKANVIDNFDGESLVSTYWDIDGTQVYQRSIVTEGAFEGTNAMRVDFQKTPDLAYSYFALQPIQDGAANDFSSFRTLRIHINKFYDPPMVLMAKFEFNGSAEVYETQVGLPANTSGWQEVIFDFSSVPQNLLSNIRDILFFVNPGHPTSAGSLLMDNIALDERTPSRHLDDFEGNNPTIETYWDGDGTVIYQRSIVEESAFDGTHAMKINFTKQTGYPYSFFGLQLKQDGISNNLSSYGSFRFHMNKMKDDPMVILMKIEGSNGESFEQQLHFPQGSNQWQEAIFDFSNAPTSLLSGVKNILFFVDPANETSTGVFYIDGIRVAEKPNVRLLDDFEGNSSLIETYWDVDGADVVYTRTVDNTQGADGTHSMKVVYNKTTQYPTSFFAMAPKQDGFANDFSSFNVLKLLVKKESIPSMQLMLKLELADTQINFESWKEIPQGATGWVELQFDLSSIDPNLLKNVKTVLFFVNPQFFTIPQASQGTFYMDSIRLAYDSDLPAKQFDQSSPPQIGWINSSVASDFDNEYHVDSLVRINAWELNAAGDLLDGTVRIVSKSTGYDSGEQNFVFTHDGQFWPFHWDTTGLGVADDYAVIVTLRDKSGNVTTVGSVDNPALIVKLTNDVPPFGELFRIQDFSLPTMGTSLPISRSYDPTDSSDFDRQLGLGWHSSLDYFVQAFPDGTVSMSFGAEGYQFFFQNPDGSYRPMAPNNYSTLSKKEGGFDLKLKDGTFYEFASAPFIDLNTKMTVTWFVTRIVDRNGNEIRFFYDENRNLTQVVNPSGDTIRLEYSLREIDQFNTKKFNLDRMIDLGGNVWSYEHDVKGNLLSVTDPKGQKTLYEYVGRGRLLKTTYADGSTQAYEYDSIGRLTKVLRNDVMQTQYSYGGRNVPVFSVTDALGRTSTYKISPEGLPVEITDALGNKTVFTYDSKRNLTKQIDAQGNTVTYTYDEKGNLLSGTDPLSGVTVYTYDPLFNQVTSITDALDHITQVVYDDKGNAIQLIDAEGNVTENTYDLRGNLTQTSDSIGIISTNTYDLRGLLLTQTDAVGNITRYEYDTRGNHTKITDAADGISLFEYDELSRLIRQTDPLTRVTSFIYDAMGRMLSQTDAFGKVTTFEYDANGWLMTQTDVMDGITRFAYDAKGNRISQTDAMDNTTIFTYDELDRVIRVTDALNRIAFVAYDSLGRMISQTDAAGNITRFEYDSLGRHTKTIYANGAIESATYDALGRTLTQTDALGNITTYSYDSRGNLKTQTNSLGAVTTFDYNVRNQNTSVTDALGNTTRFEYDLAGQHSKTIYADNATEQFGYDSLHRLTSSTNPLNRTVTYQYDAAGNLTQTTDPAGFVSKSEYDALNRRIKDIDALGNITNYTYDDLGRLTQILDARQNATRMAYNAVGQLLETTYPDTSKESFIYDKAGRVIESKDRMGRITRFTYDALNRVIEKLLPDSTKETFTYDVMGNLLTATNAAGTIRNEYDLLGQLTKQVDVFGDILEYSYDALGQIKLVTARMGLNTLSRAYTYDELGRLKEIQDEKGRLTTYTYDSRSRVTKKVLPNSASTEWTYNLASDITNIKHKNSTGTVFRSLGFSYNSRSLITKINDSLDGSTTFGYDKLARLISITHPIIGAISFGLDALGNRTQVTDDGIVESYSPNNLNEYSQVGTDLFQYDLDGSMIERRDNQSGAVTRYEYNTQRQLTKVILPDGSAVTFTYDALGRRVSKTVGNVTTRYFLNGNEMIAELDASGELLMSYVHGLEIDEVLYQENHLTGETLFFHQDHLMTTLALTDAAGQLKESYSYDPYGNLITSPAIRSTRFLYTGREFDSETGLYYNRARYYDPTLGRFISTDPKGYLEGFNLYHYGDNNPLLFRDPNGTDPYNGGGYVSSDVGGGHGSVGMHLDGSGLNGGGGGAPGGGCGSCGSSGSFGYPGGSWGPGGQNTGPADSASYETSQRLRREIQQSTLKARIDSAARAAQELPLVIQWQEVSTASFNASPGFNSSSGGMARLADRMANEVFPQKWDISLPPGFPNNFGGGFAFAGNAAVPVPVPGAPTLGLSGVLAKGPGNQENKQPGPKRNWLDKIFDVFNRFSPWIKIYRYPRAGGFGINLKIRDVRVFGLDWHRFNFRGRLVSLPHIDSELFKWKHEPWTSIEKWLK